MWKIINQRWSRLGYAVGRLRQMQVEERQLLIQALLWVVLVRLALSLMPFLWLRRGLEALHHRNHSLPLSLTPTRDQVTIDQITRAVMRIGRRIPKATCLTQALAARILLNRHGHDNRLCIGVAMSSDGNFQAHAWLEAAEEGEVLIGQLPELSRYTKLPLESANLRF